MVFNDLFGVLLQVMARDKGLFIFTGMQILRAVTVLLLLLFGAQTVLEGFFDRRKFIRLVVSVLIIQTALTYYETPAPFLGVSFTGLVTSEVARLSKILDQQGESVVFDTIAKLENSNGATVPLDWNPKHLLQYFFVEFILVLLQGVVWAVIAWGFIAEALCMIIGPYLLPFGVVPGMEWLAWGWFKAFIQYALYSVVASAYMDIAAQILTQFVARHPPPWSTVDEWLILGPLCMVMGVMVIGAIQLGSLTAGIASGSGGATAVPKFLRWS